MEKKNKNRAIIGTILFHVALALLLFVFAFRTPLPLPEEMGVIVDFGGGGGGGGETGRQTEMSSESVSHNDVTQPSTNRENVVTQNTEATHNMSSASQTQPVIKQEPIVDPRIVDFWNSSKSNTSQGKGGGKGTGEGTGTGKWQRHWRRIRSW
jgi:hypothetical protein